MPCYYRMGIQPKIFGPFMWATIHYICLAAPENLNDSQKSAYKHFFTVLPFVMPCQTCGVHLLENYKTLPIDNSLSTKEDLFKWSVDLHNIVNKQLGKSEISVEDARIRWTRNFPKLVYPDESNETTTKANAESAITNDKPKNIYFYLTIMFAILIAILIGIIYILNTKLNKKYRK